MVFRSIAWGLGAPLSFTEMVNDRGLVNRNRESLRLVSVRLSEGPVGVQLFGSEPGIMAEAARIAQDRGPCLIDINMGCPVPKVVKSGAGSALMLDPYRAARIVERVRNAVDLPVTVKMRKGWDDAGPDPCDFARMLESAGASALTVHGRTRSQGYSGRADWESIARVKQAVKIPVIGNGDVDGPASLERIMVETGCDAAMIGRAALGNPWVFRQIACGLDGGVYKVSPGERARVALEHLNAMVAEYGEARAVPQMRKHIAWYTKGLAGAARVRREVMQAKTAVELERIISWIGGMEDEHGSTCSPSN